MPPKGKGKKGKKSGKNAKQRVIIDNVATEDMTKEQLEEHVIRMRDQLDRERKERNFHQLERDRVHTFWDITQQKLTETQAMLRNKDRDIEDTEERHQTEIKVYKQKVKHLMFEHQNNITQLKAEGTVSLKLAQELNYSHEQQLRKDKRCLKVELKEMELAHEDMMKALQKKNSEQVTNLQAEFELRAREIELKYDKKMETLRDELELKRKVEIHEIEERKNSQIITLMKNHEKAFSDIKNYYNDITLNNLALINTLKEQVEDMKKKEERLEKQMADLIQDNRHLTDPLQKAKEEVEELRRLLTNYEKDKNILRMTKARLKVNMEDFKELQWEHEVLEQRFDEMQTERDELYNQFVKSIQEVHQKSNFKNLILEKKMVALSEQLEKKEGQLNEVLTCSNLDPSALNMISTKLEEVLASKNTAIKDLQFELARVCKAHNDLLQTYEAKLQAFGIPKEELGFKPLESAVPEYILGTGPAGLVSAKV
ncbi:Dynein regulatory complex subunit 4 [Argonauta hians]